MTEETIFADALQKSSPTERQAYLDQACAGDAALRQRVEALLHAHADSANFLNVPVLAHGATAGAGRSVVEITEVLSTSCPAAPPDAPPPVNGHANKQADRPRDGADDQALDFLAPSRKPGSLGHLDHYEVQEVVGSGGMGMVLKAFDEKLHRVVAIKALAPALASNGTARKRFVREAQAAAAVSHDHVVAIHAVGDAGPVPYLVMHYVAGISLEDRIKQGGPLELKEILRIGLQTACGLAAAHAQGLVHRDVKPANILLENGVQRVKITDFGLARAVDDASLTQSGVIAGTPLYMSPEQARGEAVDHRSDLFSFGSVLYTLATGHPPFRASNTMAVLKRVCEDTPRPIREINPDIPDWLCAIIGKLLAKEPAQRFQSAAGVAELLSQHLAHLQQPQVIPPPPAALRTVEPAPRRRRRSPMVLAASALAAAALLFALVGGVAYRMWPRPVPKVTTPDLIVRPTTSPFDDRKREDIPRALLALAGNGVPEQAPPELVAMLGDSRFQLPRREIPHWMAQSPDGRLLALPCGNTVVLYSVQTGEMVRQLTGHTDRALRPSFSPDGSRLAGGTLNGLIKIWDVETGQVSAAWQAHLGPVWAVGFAPDGQSLVSCSADRTAKVWDAAGKELHTLPHGGPPHHAVFSPDGKRVVIAVLEGDPKVWDPETGQEIATLRGHATNAFFGAYRRDGRLAATGSDTETILWDTETWKPRHILKAGGAGLVAFTQDGRILLTVKYRYGAEEGWSYSRWDVETGERKATLALRGKAGEVVAHLTADGRTLFAMSGLPPDARLGAYNAETGKELFPQKGHQGRVYCVAVSPDGKLLASGGDDRIVRLWDLAQWKAGEPLPPVRTLEGHTDLVRGIVFSPNGKLLATASSDLSIGLWDVESGSLLRTLIGGADLFRMEFTRDSRTLAAGCPDGSVRLWDIAGDTNREGTLLCKHTNRVRCVAYSPDGKLLASGGEDHQLWINEMATGRLVKKFTLLASVNGVMFSPDGKTLGAVCDAPDTAVHLWNVADWTESKLPGHTAHVHSVEFSPVAPLLATCGFDDTVRLWDLTTPLPRTLAISPGPSGSIVWQATFTPDGGYLVTAHENGTISVLNVPSPPKPYDPGPPRKLPDPLELAKRPSAADALKRADIPADLLAKAGGGDPQKAPPQLVAILTHYDGQILQVAISPDGKLLASAGHDGKAKIWDLSTGKLLHTCSHGLTGIDIAFAPGRGKEAGPSLLLATANRNSQTVKLWDATTGQELRTLSGHSGPLASSPDGRWLASNDHTDTIHVWDTATGKRLCMLSTPLHPHRDHVASPDGRLLATAGADGAVRLWDPLSGWLLATLQGHQGSVSAIAFLPDGRALASSGDSDRTILLWDLQTLREKQVLKGTRSLAFKLAWRADGRLLASDDCEDGTIRLWDPTAEPATCREIRLFPAPARFLLGVAMTPEGRYLATANPDGTVYILRLAERGEVYEVPPPTVELQPKSAFAAHNGAVTWSVFSTDGKILASGGKDGVLKLWNVAEQKERWSIPAHDGGIRVVALSGDGKTLATAGFDGTIRLWDAEGKKLHELPGHKGGVAPLLFSAHGEQLLSGGADGVVRFWDVKEGKEANKIDASKDWITHRSLTPDGMTLATSGNDGIVRLWDVDTGKERTSLPERNSACFSPDGKQLAMTTPEHQIKVLDAKTLEVRTILTGHTDKPDSLCFSADGRLLASCGADGSIRVWDAKHGHPLALLRGHTGRVWNVALTADGKTLAAGGEDGKLLLWDLSSL